MPLVHGSNIGHGFVKHVAIDDQGNELKAVVFPAMIARANKAVAGTLTRIETVEVGGVHWWTGEDALLSQTPTTLVAQARLDNPYFIPALVRGAHQRLGISNGQATGYCVSGLPASWAQDPEKAKALGQRLRDGYGGYQKVRIIPEPLGAIYAVLLDTQGNIVGDPLLQTSRVGVVDLGHYTVDVAIVHRLTPVVESLQTWQLGTATPLGQVRAQLSATYERELSLFETDQAIRAGTIRVAGEDRPLPNGWDRPLIANGEAVAARLVEAWGQANDLELILVAGGGAEIAQVAAAIEQRFRQVQIIEEPQIAIASGYARLAKKLSRPA